MGLKTYEEQLKTVSEFLALSLLKKEQEKISMDINNGRWKIEELEKEQGNIKDAIKVSGDALIVLEKEETAMLEDLKKIADNIEKKKGEMSVLDSEIYDKEKSIKNIKDSNDLFIEREKERIKSELVILNGLFEERNGELIKLEQIVKGQAEIKSKLIQDIGDKEAEIADKGNKLLELNKNIHNVEVKNKEVQGKIDKLLPVKEELEGVKMIRDDVKNEASAIQNEIKAMQDVLSGLEKDVSERTLVVKKKESELENREKGLSIRENAIKENEKRIKTMGNTLQKHFDNNDMKHIKVFK